ncbi:MAG: porin family protein [Bacteroidota bacterium]
MKKSLIIICALLFSFSNTLLAQGENDDNIDMCEKLTFGIKAGINYSNVWDEQGQDFEADPRVGFAGGVFLGIPIGKYLGIQPELLLSQKGFQGGGTLLGNPYSFSKTTTYIDVPIMLQIKPIEYLSIVFGPQYSYLINEKNKYTFGANSTEQEREFENDNVRKNVLGFVVGGDINVSHIVLSGRMAWDFQTNNGDGSSSTPRYKNQWLQITIGFRL